MIISNKLTASHATSAARRNPDYQIRLKRKAKALLRAQAKGKFLDNTQKRIIAQWKRIEQQNRAQEVAA